MGMDMDQVMDMVMGMVTDMELGTDTELDMVMDTVRKTASIATVLITSVPKYPRSPLIHRISILMTKRKHK